MEWLKLGSFMEDEQKYGFFGFFGSELGDERCVDHFYTVQSERTPGQTIGLTDWSEPPAFGLAVRTFTTNSFRWATDNTVQGPYGIGTNSFKWEDARQYEFAALTNSAPDDRNTGMAMMFYCLGHILHLNQDLTSPDHVRDAAHLNTAYFEKFGAANYTNNPQWFVPPQHDQQGWAYWQAQGFSKLLDFWDRSNYVNGSSQALNNEAKGDVKLGVAEFSNGNFMGETALYKECYSSGDIHSFPFPSLFSSTSYPVNKDIASYLDSHLRTNFLSNGGINPKGSLVPRVYIDKTGDGITFSNHSVLSYLGAYALGGLSGRRANPSPRMNQVSVSIHDNNVLQAYHDRLIPKAVEYSTGILDYFFRGTISATVIGYDTNLMQYTNLIVNTSGQDFYGGAFSIYEDDTSSLRAFVTQTNFSGKTLPSSNSLVMTFPGPLSSFTNLLLVYQGTIGIANGNSAQDPVDAGIGIASSRVLPFEQTTNYDYLVLLSDLGLPNGSTIVSNLASGDFPFPLTAGHYEVKVNFALFDDKGTIGSLPSTGPLGNCEGWPCEITNTVVPAGDVSISPDGKSLSVPITATDNADCGVFIGWWDVSVTWRAWPATQ